MVREIGRVASLQQRGSLTRWAWLSSKLHDSAFCIVVEATPHRDPLGALFNPGGKTRHTVDSQKPSHRGDRACLGSAHRRAHFDNPAHRIDLRSGSTLRRAPTRWCAPSSSSCMVGRLSAPFSCLCQCVPNGLTHIVSCPQTFRFPGL